MKEEYQVIIVGAGPAGAACAKALHNAGISVLVIEKEILPRNKTCSSVLFGQTQVLLQKYFGSLPPADVYCEPKIIHADNILEWKGGDDFINYRWEIPMCGQSFSKEYHNTWRNKFDHWLLKESGAPYREDCKFNSYSISGGKIKVEVSRKDKETADLYCSYLIGADGWGSRLRNLLDPSYQTMEPAVSVYQAYYRFSDLGKLKYGNWYVFFEPSIGESLSCVHEKGEFLTLCVSGLKGRSLKNSMENLKLLLAEKFQVVLKDMERDEGCIMKIGKPFLGTGNILLTGEAAGLLYLNAEGISVAIDSGYRAGKAVIQSMKEGGNIQELYSKDLEGIFQHMGVCMENVRFFVPRS